MIKTSLVVLLARINDPVLLVTNAQFTTIVDVEHDSRCSPEDVAEMALELAPQMDAWQRV